MSLLDAFKQVIAIGNTVPVQQSKTTPATPVEVKLTTFTPQHSIQLKLKGMSLAAETRIIRRWEKRLQRAQNSKPSLNLQDQVVDLHQHRLYKVRTEARDTYLAYGFLKGRPYTQIENLRYRDPNWENIARMARLYGPRDPRNLMQHFEAWKQAAASSLKQRPPKKIRVRPSNQQKVSA